MSIAIDFRSEFFCTLRRK